MKLNQFVLVFLLSFLFFTKGNSQGCSDAGFCTIASSADFSTSFNVDSINNEDNQSKKNFVKLSLGNHLGELSTFLIIPTADISFQVGNPRSRISIRIASQIAMGNNITQFGFGDIALTHSYNVINRKTNHQFIFNYGFMLATGRSNATKNDVDLPMVYQSSLGTFDMLLGLNYKYRYKLGSVNFASGYQHPFTNINRNKSFTVFDDELETAFTSESFVRKGDVFFRADKVFTLVKNKMDIGAGVLGIYHVADDEIEYLNSGLKEFEAIQGSKGITLNITALVNFRVNEKIELGLSAGFPVIVRDARPDGLTRTAVISPSFLYRF